MALAVAAVTAAAATPARAGTPLPGPDYVPGQVVVRYHDGAAAAVRARVRWELGVRRGRPAGLPGVELLSLPPGELPHRAAARLRRSRGVRWAEPHLLYGTDDRVPNDPLFRSQWMHRGISTPAAWDITTGTRGVTVAVVDTGVAYDHPDLAPNMWRNPAETANGADDDRDGLVDDIIGYDFVDGDPDPRDISGHGTQVVAALGARGNDGQGIAGVNWEVSVMALRAGTAAGQVSSVAAARAFRFAAAKGVRVVNGSFGGPVPSRAIADAIAASPDTLFVFSAGDRASNNDVAPHYPASLRGPNVLSVAATDARGRLAPASNFGSSNVDVAAPGRSLLLDLPASQLPFQDGFEGGMGSWSPSVGSSWSTSSGAASQGSFSMTDSQPGGPYPPVAESSVETTLDLTGRSPCQVEFALLRRLEEGDQLHVEADGGSGQFGPLGPAVTGSGEEFERVTRDLAASSGRPGVRLRFRLQPDGDPATADGVYIDDVVVRCFSPQYPHGPEVGLAEGTSFAAPLVSGVAALLLSVDPGRSGARLRDRVLLGAKRLPALEGLVSTGARIDALGALPLPAVSSLRVFPRSLRAAARVSFRTSLPGRLALVVERPAPGRRERRRCVAPAPRNRGARSCTRQVVVRRTSVRVAAGRGGARLARRLGRRSLSPGAYRLAATLVDGHRRRSRPARAAFRVLGAAR